MPRNKDLKRLVRARMEKTGESYTAARAQLVKTPAVDLATLTGMADEKVLARTGYTWVEWVRLLDAHDAAKMAHRDIALLVSTRYGAPDWWTQMVTVGYERIKGIRARGQRLDGTYEASKSKTFDVPVSKLFDAWAMPATRKKWLDDRDMTVRTSNKPKYIRFGFADGSVVVVGFTAKGRAKTAVNVQHMKLPDKQAADGLKRYWNERLTALGAMLSPE